MYSYNIELPLKTLIFTDRTLQKPQQMPYLQSTTVLITLCPVIAEQYKLLDSYSILSYRISEHNSYSYDLFIVNLQFCIYIKLSYKLPEELLWINQSKYHLISSKVLSSSARSPNAVIFTICFFFVNSKIVYKK